MGGTRQRPGVQAVSASTIQIAFTYKGVVCRERIKLEPTPANMKRAELHRAAILNAIRLGQFDYAATFPNSPRRLIFAPAAVGLKLETYLESWLNRQKAHLKASTFEGYRKIIFGTLIPKLGSKTLAELKRGDVKAMAEGIEASNKTIGNVLSVLRKAMHDAVADELLDASPLAEFEFKRKEPPREDGIDPFSAEEQTAILAAAIDEQHRNLFQFAFWTGMRTSELVALEWRDIDWLRGYVRVSRAMTQASEEAESTKTRKGTRDVKLLPPAIAALQAQKAHSFMANGAVFLNPRTGQAWLGDQAIRKTAWIPALRKAGVRYRWPYQTRHTYASMMLTAGESQIWVAAQMGHTDLQMISRRYGRWIKDAAPEAGNKAVAMFAPEVLGEKKAV